MAEARELARKRIEQQCAAQRLNGAAAPASKLPAPVVSYLATLVILTVPCPAMQP